jgi:hypothetical protein
VPFWPIESRSASYKFAIEKLQLVHENCTQVDTARALKIVKSTQVDAGLEPEEENTAEQDFQNGGVDYPKDDINPDDIPF